MATIALQNEMYKGAVKKQSLLDKFIKYYKENAFIICAGLVAMNGQNISYLYKSFER